MQLRHHTSSPSLPRGRGRRGQRGLTLIEVTVSLVVVSVLMLAALSAFGSSLGASKAARRTTDAAIFLEATLENLSAQNFDAVIAMNGNRFFDGEDENSSRYAADLVAFQSSVDLMQIELDLVDLQTNRRLGRLATLRSR